MEGDERFDVPEMEDHFKASASSIVSGWLVGVSVLEEFESRVQSVSPSKDRRSAKIIGGVEPTFIAATDSTKDLSNQTDQKGVFSFGLV